MASSLRLGALFLIVFLLSPVLPALAQDAALKAAVRAGVHDGFGRIVFDFGGRQEGYKLRQTDDGLEIEFDKAFAIDLAPLRRHLFRYLDKADMSDGGKRVTLKLTRQVTPNDRWIDDTLVIDLVDKAAAASASGGGERVAVRAGDHAEYSRLVFDLSRDTDYRVEQKAGAIDVSFAAEADFDLAPVLADKPDRVRSIAQVAAATGAQVHIEVPADARVRHFRSGSKVVVDILSAAPAAPAVAETKPTPKSKPAAEPVRRKTEAAPAPRSLLSAKTAPADTGDKPAVPAVKTTQVDTAALAPRRASGNSKSLELAVDQVGDKTFLTFAWPEPVAAAAFERAGFFWLVFDRQSTPSLDALRPEDGVLMAQQIRNTRATVLRMQIRADRFPAVFRKGANWLVELGERSAGARQGLPAVPQPQAAEGARVFLPVSDTGERVTIYDPEIGDELVVVPLQGDGIGVVAPYRFVQFDLLPTIQGVVVRPNVDDIRLDPLRNGVAISAESGLVLSPSDQFRSEAEPSPYRASVKQPIIHLDEWAGGRDTDFNRRRKALQRLLARSPAAGRSIARYEMAKFYIGNGLAAEGQALLKLISQEDPGAEDDPQFRALRGITASLMGRLDEAATDLMHAELKLYPDVALWRGDLLTRQGKPAQALKEYELAAAIPPELTDRLRERVMLQWAQAAVDVGDEAAYRRAENELKRLPADNKIKTALGYFEGRLAMQAGDSARALQEFETAIAADYRPYRARADFERVNAALANGTMTPEAAVKRLDSLRFAWRGDDFERTVVDRMIDIELASEHYEEALSHLRDAISYFPESPLTKGMAQKMNQTFNTLFLDGKADSLSPVSALALYYEFQELTPLGDSGDTMIQRLADRLAAVDLLGKAATLLEHQVTYRLRGGEKARIGARLAVIYLLDAKPEAARDALQRTDFAVVPEALRTERRYLDARALAELGRADEALQLLGEDDSGAAELLRSDIYWRDRRWSDAARTALSLLGERWRSEAALSNMEQTQIVQIAVSLYMSNDVAGLTTLRDRYGDKMAGGPFAETFGMLTYKVDPSKTEFRKLAGEIARTSELESFMASYRDRLKAGGLSALN